MLESSAIRAEHVLLANGRLRLPIPPAGLASFASCCRANRARGVDKATKPANPAARQFGYLKHTSFSFLVKRLGPDIGDIPANRSLAKQTDTLGPDRFVVNGSAGSIDYPVSFHAVPCAHRRPRMASGQLRDPSAFARAPLGRSRALML